MKIDARSWTPCAIYDARSAAQIPDAIAEPECSHMPGYREFTKKGPNKVNLLRREKMGRPNPHLARGISYFRKIDTGVKISWLAYNLMRRSRIEGVPNSGRIALRRRAK